MIIAFKYKVSLYLTCAGPRQQVVCNLHPIVISGIYNLVFDTFGCLLLITLANLKLEMDIPMTEQQIDEPTIDG